jgi:hypothetical protein
MIDQVERLCADNAIERVRGDMVRTCQVAHNRGFGVSFCNMKNIAFRYTIPPKSACKDVIANL